MSILGVLVGTDLLTAGWANLVATAAGTGPSFELNRRWVWGRGGHRSILAEIGPFAALSLLGLALSSLAASSAAGWAAANLGDQSRALAAQVASLATFGALWVAQYAMCDRVLFRPSGRPSVQAAPEALPIREEVGQAA
jgi:putative flippase GtrA